MTDRPPHARPANAHPANAHAPHARPPNADPANARPLRAALVGLGMVAPTHARALRDADGVELAAVCSRDPERAAAFAAEALRSGDASLAPAVAPGIDALAADPAIDLVVLATPPNARAEAVSRLAAAGKPILMEKPVERTLHAARGLVEACEAAGVPLGIVLQHRARPSARTLRDLLAEGALGTIAAIEVNVPWWRPQSYYDEPGRGSYARDGGGVLISQAIHAIDLALHLAAPSQGAVRSVTARLSRTGLHAMEAEDHAVIGLELEGGAVGSIVATTAAHPGGTEWIALHGTRGSAVLRGDALTLDGHDGTHREIGEGVATGGGADPMAFTHDWHRAVVEDFARVVRGGGEPIASGRDALAVHGLIDAATRASHEGRTIEPEDA